MRGQRGWRELAILGEKADQFSMMEELNGPPKSGEVKSQNDDWTVEEVISLSYVLSCDEWISLSYVSNV